MAFRTQKISQMTPKGANLEATDLIEVSTIESGSYVTRSVTGQELIDAIPPAAATWGSITGTLSSQTDLQSALNAKQDTLTLTTTGTSGAATLVGSTLNIPQYSGSSSLTIGSTAIASGVAGRILFEGAGNVLQQSSSLFWDNTNGRLGIGTSTPSVPIHGLVNNQNIVARFEATGTGEGNIEMSGIAPQLRATTTNGASGFRVSIFGSITGDIFRLQDSATTLINVKKTGNVLINTTTDAGFRLDVNGTARVSGTALFQNSTFGTAIQINNQAGNAFSLAVFSVGAGDTNFQTQGNYSGNNFRITAAGFAMETGGLPTLNASAILSLNSTVRGFLPPRMTTTQKNAIASPAAGLQVYDTTLNRPCFYDGTTWITL
jgi:hypothetical protein